MGSLKVRLCVTGLRDAKDQTWQVKVTGNLVQHILCCGASTGVVLDNVDPRSDCMEQSHLKCIL